MSTFSSKCTYSLCNVYLEQRSTVAGTQTILLGNFVV